MTPMTDKRPLDTELDWPFFDPAFGLTPATRSQIHALAPAAAAALWASHVSAVPAERHGMLLPATHWLNTNLKTAGPDWQHEVNTWAIAAFIQQGLATAAGADVYFITMREQAWRVRVEIFIAHWPAFLSLDDEAPFVFDPASGQYVAFGPQGSLFSANKFINRAAFEGPTADKEKK